MILVAVGILSLGFFSCENPGTTKQRLSGDESALPAELKGLKVYSVYLPGPDGGKGSAAVLVAVLDNQVNSVTYRQGKSQATTIMVNGTSRQISVEILSENDSIIVARKK